MSRPFFHEGSGLSGCWFAGPNGARHLQVHQTLIPGSETGTAAQVGFVQLSEAQWRDLLGELVARALREGDG